MLLTGNFEKNAEKRTQEKTESRAQSSKVEDSTYDVLFQDSVDAPRRRTPEVNFDKLKGFCSDFVTFAWKERTPPPPITPLDPNMFKLLPEDMEP